MARYHLDTSFLIDWQRGDPKIVALRDAILAGGHEVSFDPIVETEYFAARSLTREAELLFRSVEVLARRIQLSQGVCRQAAAWLGPMNDQMRRKHFGDALIASAAALDGATILSADRRINRVFPVPVETY